MYPFNGKCDYIGEIVDFNGFKCRECGFNASTILQVGELQKQMEEIMRIRRSPCRYETNRYCDHVDMSGYCDDKEKCDTYDQRTCDNCPLEDDETCEHYLC